MKGNTAMPPKKVAQPKVVKTTVTFTCAEVGENHVGMEAIDRKGQPGVRAARGFSVEHLEALEAEFTDRGYEVELAHLDAPEGRKVDEEAAILIVRNFLSEEDGDELLKSALELEWDAKYLDVRRGRVLNKRKRKNLLFADFAQKPAYEEGKGRVVEITDLEVLSRVLADLEAVLPLDELGITQGLIVEGNLYPLVVNGKEDPNIGIGFHGDTERRIVVGLRVGESMSLVFEWYADAKRLGKRYEFTLNSGDVYVMSNKATGYDWKRRSQVTLRHAAGGAKVTA